MAKVAYEPDGKIIQAYFADRSPVSCIQGPVGSGTSTASCFKSFCISKEQAPDSNGVRRSRWVFTRNTYNDLKETTLKTWRYWFEEKAEGRMGEVKMTNPPRHEIRWDLPDGTTIEAEWLFLALDSEDDNKKLLSMEYTGAWMNEAQFSEKSIFDTIHSRAMQGRYPPKLDGGPTWKGVLLDLNAPPEGHWIPYMRGDIAFPDEWDDDQRREYKKPDDWNFFVQPPGLLETIENGKVVGYQENPEAENMKWLTESYLKLVEGKPKAWIDTYVMNRVGFYRAGKPVFESFRPEIHVSEEPIDYVPEWPLIIGMDFARNPAIVIGQVIRGVVYILDEFGMENVAAGTFAPLVRQRIMRKFPEAMSPDSAGIQFWGDPTGDSKGQGTDLTPYQIFQKNGMAVSPAPGNNAISARLEAVQMQIDKMVDGSPGLLISPSCRVLKVGMGGGYHYAKLKGQMRHHEAPHKDRYADYCDALQYLCLGAGLGTIATIGDKPLTPLRTRRKRKFSLRR